MLIRKLTLAAFAFSAHLLSAGSFQVVGNIPLGGENGWDYLAVDAPARRLYVSHATQVDVIDLNTEKPVGKVADTPGVHGIAVAPDLGRGFIAAGKANRVTIFDLKTLNVLGQVPTENNPNALVYDPVTKRVFVLNKASSSATVFEAATGKVVKTIPLEGILEFVVTDGKGTIFFNVQDKAEMVKLDTRSMQVLQKWPLAPCEDAVGLAMDRKNGRLFTGCRNGVAVAVDANSGHVVSHVPIGKGIDAMAYDPELKLVFSSNGDGTLTIIHQDSPDQYTVLENAPTRRGARTMTLDPQTHRLYLSVADYPADAKPGQRMPALPGTFKVLIVKQ